MSSSCERIEWVEIIEPRTKEHMYANLTTGECVWDPPDDVPIKRTDSSQWWELFDTNTQRFYYYNAATQKTVWHRPNKCDIIPLAKLQTLKQNTDPSDRKENSTQTQSPITAAAASKIRTQRSISGGICANFPPTNKRTSGGNATNNVGSPLHASSEEKLSSDIISSPRGRQSQSFRAAAGDSPRSSNLQEFSRRSQDSCNHYKESGKSSDSSLSSIHGYRRINDGSGVAGIGTGGNENFRVGSLQKQRSRKDRGGNSSNNTADRYYDHHQLLPAHHKPGYCSSSKSSDIVHSPTHSAHTPPLPSQPKKKISPDALQQHQQQQYQQHQIAGGVGKSPYHDMDFGGEREAKVALARSGSLMSPGMNPNAVSGHHHSSKSYRKSSGEANGAASDDSMHEKYFKSVESTPLTRRRHTEKGLGLSASSTATADSNKKHSSDSSPQSPISPQTKTKSTKVFNNAAVGAPIGSCALLHSPAHSPGIATPSSSSHSHYKKDSSCSLELLNLDKISLSKPLTSPHLSDVAVVGNSSISPNNMTGASLKNFPSSDNIGMLTHSSRGSNDSRNKHKLSTSSFNRTRHNQSHSQQQQQQHHDNRSTGSLRHNTSSLDKHDRYFDSRRDKRDSRKSSKQHRNNHTLNADNSDVEYDNGNISPLYSNWDQEMQEHLLPLKNFIIEQAKLKHSGRYVFREPTDSDSYHSDTQSEHSLSGHEPDNEDSDGGSDTHGGYLEHNYGMIDDYANMGDSVSYYAYQYPLYDPAAREDISDNVEAVLEGIGGAVTEISQKPKQPRYQISYYDTAANAAQTPMQHYQHQQTQQQQQQQLYSNTPLLPYMQQQQPHPPPHQNIQLDAADTNKQKQHQQQQQQQSHTLPTTGMASSNGSNNTTSKIRGRLPPPSLKPTIQQIFPPSERAPPPHSSIGLQQPTLACMKECDIEKFAADNLNLHSKGIFRKKSSVRDMLSFTAEGISRPMLALSRDKTEKKIAIELFKLVQIYMGDRKARAGMSLNSVAIDIITSALPQHQLRDELYVQLCRQTTENPKRESLIRGWELMAICLSFVPPSPTFQPALLNYVNRHRDPTFATSFPEVGKWPIHVQISHYATVCCRRLERIGSSGRRQAKKPTDDEIEQARTQILRNSMFGNTLAEVMELQKDKFPFSKLPWIQTTLSEHVLYLNGKQTEGIFRVSADVDEVNALKSRLDRWEVPDYKNTMVDAHSPASLLKLWYRELYDPLIPDSLYEECVNTEDPDKAKEIVNKLPELNKLVLTYLVHFLQQFSHPDVVSCTKMDSSNLAMVFAPNCLRCTSDDPKVILENARKEMSFMRTLILHMDTTAIANLV